VSYSARVRSELKDLLTRAAASPLGRQALEAAKIIDYRLRVYPQFGDPLRDLVTEGETLWIATVPPLVVEYVIDEPRRAVFVVVPFRPLPNSGL
jgi:hypothetical protein